MNELWKSMTNEELAVEYQATKSNELFEFFIEKNTKLLKAISLNYRRQFPNYEDDFNQACIIAAWQCLLHFDITKGVKYSTLLDYYVRAQCQAVIRMRHTMKLPRYIWEDIDGYRHKYPSRIFGTISFDADYTSGEEDCDGSLIDVAVDSGPTPEEKGIHSEQERYLLDIMRKILKPAEFLILKMRFGLEGYSPMTLQAIGAEFKVTRERIRQLEVKGLRKLKAYLIERGYEK